jgi:phage antirepressor YoqD-like protein
MSKAVQMIEIPGLGRNKLYRILKALGIVDHHNRPEQEYINAGLLATPLVKTKTHVWGIMTNVTHIVGNEGLEFIKRRAMEYLKDNPMPTFPHRPKVSSGTNI